MIYRLDFRLAGQQEKVWENLLFVPCHFHAYALSGYKPIEARRFAPYTHITSKDDAVLSRGVPSYKILLSEHGWITERFITRLQGALLAVV